MAVAVPFLEIILWEIQVTSAVMRMNFSFNSNLTSSCTHIFLMQMSLNWLFTMLGFSPKAFKSAMKNSSTFFKLYGYLGSEREIHFPMESFASILKIFS